MLISTSITFVTRCRIAHVYVSRRNVFCMIQTDWYIFIAYWCMYDQTYWSVYSHTRTHSICITRTHERIHQGIHIVSLIHIMTCRSVFTVYKLPTQSSPTRQSTYSGEPLSVTWHRRVNSYILVGYSWESFGEQMSLSFMMIWISLSRHSINTWRYTHVQYTFWPVCTCVAVSKRVCSLDPSSQDARTYAGRPHTRCCRCKAKRLGTWSEQPASHEHACLHATYMSTSLYISTSSRDSFTRISCRHFPSVLSIWSWPSSVHWDTALQAP